MIIGFKDKGNRKKFITKAFLNDFLPFIQRLALRKLMLLDNAESLQDLRWPPGTDWNCSKEVDLVNYSLRINSFYDVEIVDYH